MYQPFSTKSAQKHQQEFAGIRPFASKGGASLTHARPLTTTTRSSRHGALNTGSLAHTETPQAHDLTDWHRA